MQKSLKTYFHCAPLPLGPGSIICPGNWGRIKRAFEENGVQLAREAAFEAIRKEEFAHLPSRLEAAYVCPADLAASAYRAKHARSGLLYEVELVTPDAPSHMADHELYLQPFTGLDGANDLARRYWRGESLGHPEMLTLSPLRIIRCIDPIAPSIIALQP